MTREVITLVHNDKLHQLTTGLNDIRRLYLQRLGFIFETIDGPSQLQYLEPFEQLSDTILSDAEDECFDRIQPLLIDLGFPIFSDSLSKDAENLFSQFIEPLGLASARKYTKSRSMTSFLGLVHRLHDAATKNVVLVPRVLDFVLNCQPSNRICISQDKQEVADLENNSQAVLELDVDWFDQNVVRQYSVLSCFERPLDLIGTCKRFPLHYGSELPFFLWRWRMKQASDLKMPDEIEICHNLQQNESIWLRGLIDCVRPTGEMIPLTYRDNDF